MQLETDKTTLVIAGAWNPAILSPSWIAREVWHYDPRFEFQVEIQLPATVAVPEQPQRFRFEGLDLQVAFNSLTFYFDATNQDSSRRTREAACGILEQLRHTPVSAFGFNQVFSITSPSDRLSEIFEGQANLFEDLELRSPIQEQAWSAILPFESHLLNVRCARNGTRTEVSFNHHFNTDSAEKASSRLRDGDLFSDLARLSQTVAQKIEGEVNVG
nr:hypothetical protein [Variovorax boronicumulans]